MSGSSSFKSKKAIDDGTKIEKATGPFGSKIIPEKFNGTAPAANIGGFEDAQPKRGLIGSSTARRGAGAGAAQTNATPTQRPPSAYPGQAGKAKPNPLAPTSLSQVKMAKGSSQGGRAEGSTMASFARSGGKKVPMNPTRHQQPALPAAAPSFPKATGPKGLPVPAPKPSGTMSGVMQGGKGTPTGRSNLSS